MASNDYIEFVCSKPRKFGTRFYDEDYLDLEDEENIPVDYQTKCCHQEGDKKRKFTLNFGVPTDECEEVNADTERCKNFWEFVDSEPILAGLIKEGRFVHSNQPFGVGKCSAHRMIVTPDKNKSIWRLNYERAQEIKAHEREVLRRRHEQTKALQLKSGQAVYENIPLCTDGIPPQGIYAYMLQDDLDGEFDSMTEYDNDLKLQAFFKDDICWDDDDVDDDVEVTGEFVGESDFGLGPCPDEVDEAPERLTEEIIKKQSFLKEILDARSCKEPVTEKCRFQYRSGSSDLSEKVCAKK